MPAEGGRLIPGSLEEQVIENLLRPSPIFNLMSVLERAALRTRMSRRQMVLFRLRVFRSTWSYRIGKAIDHLRGIDCDGDW